MSAVSVIINILALIGLVVIIGYLIYYFYQYLQNKTNQVIANNMNPPGPYMQNSGIKCPDYWVNTGVDANGNYICKNSFNINTINPTTGSMAGKCSSDQLVFSPTQKGYTWEYNNPNGLTSLTKQEQYNFLNANGTAPISRCQWINSCGPSTNVQGIWSGVNEICNSPPPSS
jgi:hypothetical protein